MVIHFCAILVIAMLIQSLFFVYAIKHEAKGDKGFYRINIISIAILFAHAMNMAFLHLGDEGAFASKMCLSVYLSLYASLIGVFTSIKVMKFEGRTKYSGLVKFIVTIIVTASCSISFMNLWDESFFHYIVRTVEIGFSHYLSAKVMVLSLGEFWKLYIFFWMTLVLIYGLLDITRIVIRGIVNSVSEIIVLIVFIIQMYFFISLIDKPQILISEMSVYAFLVPMLYYYIFYHNKTWLVKKTLQSKLFNYSSELSVIFNADDLLAEYNHQAEEFFGFTQKDVLKFSVKDFIRDFVPLGTVPSDSISIDQIFVKNRKDQRILCQLQYHRMTYFKNNTVCSIFNLHDISSIYESFAEIQQASMTDHITGLLAQHVLIKKIREINIFRRFPYTAASCSINVHNDNDAMNENFALVKVAECIKANIRGTDFASYENGNIVLLFPAEMAVAKNVMERIVSAIDHDDYLKNDITFQFGLASRESPDEDIQQTINRAHSIMFKNRIEASIHTVPTT